MITSFDLPRRRSLRTMMKINVAQEMSTFSKRTYHKCCGIAHNVFVTLLRQVGEGFVYCIVGVSWEVWSHATSVIVAERVKWVGMAQTNVDGHPKKDLMITCVRLTTRVSRMPNQASNVNGTGT